MRLARVLERVLRRGPSTLPCRRAVRARRELDDERCRSRDRDRPRVSKFDEALGLGDDLLFGAEDVRVVLREARARA